MDIQKDNRIYQFQSDYINGTGSHGEVHKQYAAALGKYKALYAKCPIFFATGVADLQMGENGCLKKGVITDAVLLLLSLLGLGSWIMWCVVAVIASAVKWWQAEGEQDSEDSPGEYDISLSALAGKANRWFIPYVVVIVYAVLTALPIIVQANVDWAWFPYSVPLLIDLWKRLYAWKIAPLRSHEENKQRILAMRKAEAELDGVRREFKFLLPALEAEYAEGLAKTVAGIPGADAQEITRQYGTLPQHFWWEVNPSQILEKQMSQESIHNSWDTSYQIASIQRGYGKEFQDAGKNYAPMLPERLTLAQMQDAYKRNVKLVRQKGGVVLDFVSCMKYSEMVHEADMVKDYDYEKDSFTRSFEIGRWDSLGEDMEQAYRDGRLSERDYKELTSRYNSRDREVRNAINRKVETGEHIETYQKLKIFGAFEWTGQALLLPDSENPGGYVLLDYRCRPEYELENLECLGEGDCFITGFLPDYAWGQQDFIAKMQRIVLKQQAWMAGQEDVRQQRPGDGKPGQRSPMKDYPRTLSSLILVFMAASFQGNVFLGSAFALSGAYLGWRGMRKEQKKWIGAIGLILNIIVLMMVIYRRMMLYFLMHPLGY